MIDGLMDFMYKIAVFIYFPILVPTIFDILYHLPTLTSLHSEGKFSGQVSQYVEYVQRCLEVTIMIKMNTNNPSLKSVSSVIPSFGC